MAVESDSGSSNAEREQMSGMPTRSTIPQSSRLLQPTLSSQYKASYSSETIHLPIGRHLDDVFEDAGSDSLSEVSSVALSIRSQGRSQQGGVGSSASSWRRRSSPCSSDGLNRRTSSASGTSRQASGTLDVQELLMEAPSPLQQQRSKLRHVPAAASARPHVAALEGPPPPLQALGYRGLHGRNTQVPMSPQTSGQLADTLQLQRSQLRPVQTNPSTKALLQSKPARTSSKEGNIRRTGSKDVSSNLPQLATNISRSGSKDVSSMAPQSGSQPSRTGSKELSTVTVPRQGPQAPARGGSRNMAPLAAVPPQLPKSSASRKGLGKGGAKGSAAAAPTAAAVGGHDAPVQATTSTAAGAHSRHAGGPTLFTAGDVPSVSAELQERYGDLSGRLETAALQRGVSLTQVPVRGEPNPKLAPRHRESFEELRTRMNSFTEGYGTVSSSKALPARRVSTGAITPAFLEQKNRRDEALLASLDYSADLPEPVLYQASTSTWPVAADKPTQLQASIPNLKIVTQNLVYADASTDSAVHSTAPPGLAATSSNSRSAALSAPPTDAALSCITSSSLHLDASLLTAQSSAALPESATSCPSAAAADLSSNPVTNRPQHQSPSAAAVSQAHHGSSTTSKQPAVDSPVVGADSSSTLPLQLLAGSSATAAPEAHRSSSTSSVQAHVSGSVTEPPHSTSTSTVQASMSSPAAAVPTRMHRRTGSFAPVPVSPSAGMSISSAPIRGSPSPPRYSSLPKIREVNEAYLVRPAASSVASTSDALASEDSVMHSEVSYNTAVRNKWNHHPEDLQRDHQQELLRRRTASIRLAKQYSLPKNDSEAPDTIKAYGSDMPAGKLAADASPAKSAIALDAIGFDSIKIDVTNGPAKAEKKQSLLAKVASAPVKASKRLFSRVSCTCKPRTKE